MMADGVQRQEERDKDQWREDGNRGEEARGDLRRSEKHGEVIMKERKGSGNSSSENNSFAAGFPMDFPSGPTPLSAATSPKPPIFSAPPTIAIAAVVVSV